MTYAIKAKRQSEKRWRFIASQGSTLLRVHAMHWPDRHAAQNMADYQKRTQEKFGPFTDPYAWKVVKL